MVISSWSIPCFTGLAPHVLTTYDQLHGALARDVHSSELQGLSSDFAVLRRFDHYFQELHPEGRPDPDIIFDDNWSYFVVDFQGWSRRQIPLHVAHHYYLLFASSVGMEDESNVVLFRRWEPLGNLLVEQPSAMQDVEESGVVRGTGEIRELHKYNHAPTDGSHFDLDGRPQRSACLPDGSHRNRLSQRESRHSRDLSSRRWLRQMTDGQARSASSCSDNIGRAARNSRPTSRLSSMTCSSGRSASPHQRIFPHRREDSPPNYAILRQRAVARLCEYCANITHSSTVWTMPLDMEWDLAFLDGSFLLFPDNRTLTQLRYWAVCSSAITDVRSLLELAISRNMKFIMATTLSDLRIFRPDTAPELSELTKRTYEAGFQEEHLKDVNGGVAFRDQYMGKLADILRRPGSSQYGGPYSLDRQALWRSFARSAFHGGPLSAGHRSS